MRPEEPAGFDPDAHGDAQLAFWRAARARKDAGSGGADGGGSGESAPPAPLPPQPALAPKPDGWQLPIESHGAVFLRWEEERVQLMKALIAPAHDTPYGGGLFEFDMTLNFKFY